MARALNNARLLVAALRDPAEAVATLDADGWNALIAMARAEQLIGTLGFRLHGLALPEGVARTMADARAGAEQGRLAARWEAEMARRALATVGVPIVVLKGTAFVCAGLRAGVGRSIGDLDILVPEDSLAAVEAALLGAGWEWVKPDPYDDHYYRRWMHELPPLIHHERDRMIDVHHNILPRTARPTPNPGLILADSTVLKGALNVPSPTDMIVHAAAHLFADGDLAGGLRNLWDIHCLIDEFGTEGLEARAHQHGLGAVVRRAGRQAWRFFGTNIPDAWRHADMFDAAIAHRLTARDGWGRATRPLLRMGFYLRGHALRMPPGLLARHLWIKWRKNRHEP